MQNIERETGHMDRLTQAANSVDELVEIMYSSLSYMTRQASFKPVGPVPVTQTIPNIDSPEVFRANQQELVGDFIRKAKQLEYLISVLPNDPARESSSNEDDDPELKQLEQQVQQTNREYLEALAEAERLNVQIQTDLRAALDSRTLPAP